MNKNKKQLGMNDVALKKAKLIDVVYLNTGNYIAAAFEVEGYL